MNRRKTKKTLPYRAFIAAAILAAAASLSQSFAYGRQKQDANGKYALAPGESER
jgi:hypothetical protein